MLHCASMAGFCFGTRSCKYRSPSSSSSHCFFSFRMFFIIILLYWKGQSDSIYKSHYIVKQKNWQAQKRLHYHNKWMEEIWESSWCSLPLKWNLFVWCAAQVVVLWSRLENGYPVSNKLDKESVQLSILLECVVEICWPLLQDHRCGGHSYYMTLPYCWIGQDWRPCITDGSCFYKNLKGR